MQKKTLLGKTKRTLRERFTGHRQATNNPLHANAKDMELMPLELQPIHSTSRRKAKEAYLIYRGKTLSPDGINRRNEHWFLNQCSFALIVKMRTYISLAAK